MKKRDSSQPRLWAQLRFSVVAELLASPPEVGELRHRLEELAEKRWMHPMSEEWVHFGVSSIERWYYTARHSSDPIAALTRRMRSDAGQARAMSTELLHALKVQYDAHHRWSYQLHADNIIALATEAPKRYGPAPSYSTVRRRMQARGWVPKRVPRKATPGQVEAAEHLEKREVRSFEASHVHALWHYDFHQGSLRVIDAAGQWHVPQCFCVLDDYSRVCPHIQWYTQETADRLIHGLTQGFCKRGLPRAVLHDHGSAMRATETQNGLAELGILSKPTLAYSAYQNGKQETFWGQVEGRLLAMLERVEALSLELLNRATLAWVEMEYHRSHHDEIGMSPLKRLLDGPDVSRPCPDVEGLRRAFTVQEKRTQRLSDGTITIAGVRFELPSRLRTLHRPLVRYQRWDLSTAWIVDERDELTLARIYPLDKTQNANARRRALVPLDVGDEIPTAPASNLADPVPPLMRQYLAEYAATGLPAAYLPKDELTLAAATMVKESCDV